MVSLNITGKVFESVSWLSFAIYSGKTFWTSAFVGENGENGKKALGFLGSLKSIDSLAILFATVFFFSTSFFKGYEIYRSINFSSKLKNN